MLAKRHQMIQDFISNRLTDVQDHRSLSSRQVQMHARANVKITRWVCFNYRINSAGMYVMLHSWNEVRRPYNPGLYTSCAFKSQTEINH